MKRDKLNNIELEASNAAKPGEVEKGYSNFEYFTVVGVVGIILLTMSGESWAVLCCNSACVAYLLYYGIIRSYGVGGKVWTKILPNVIRLVFAVGAVKLFISRIGF